MFGDGVVAEVSRGSRKGVNAILVSLDQARLRFLDLSRGGPIGAVDVRAEMCLI
jgi:hypothetical protein